MARALNIGLFGFGNVGSGLVELIRKNEDILESRTGIRLNIKGALVRDVKKTRPINGVPLTTQPQDLIENDEIDLIVELIGGTGSARDLVVESLKKRKHVVTANKALLADHGGEIFSIASESDRAIGFEASVCGGIPLIRALTDGLVANRIENIYGILNGTSNYILTGMLKRKQVYDDVLKEAQQLGFAEPDPTFDVTGIDAAQKLTILYNLAFGEGVAAKSIHVQGIEGIDLEDVVTATDLGYVIKPLAFGCRVNGGCDLWVRPVLIPTGHPLANVNDENNAVLIKGDAAGELMLYGKGAGRLPTASAVLSDIIEIARSPVHHVSRISGQKTNSSSSTRSRFYLRFPIPDRPGAIGKIATVLGQYNISLSHALATLVDPDQSKGQVKILTHETSEVLIDRALSEIDRWPELAGRPIAIKMLE
jgi:homoserine dehydrogenase